MEEPDAIGPLPAPGRVDIFARRALQGSGLDGRQSKLALPALGKSTVEPMVAIVDVLAQEMAESYGELTQRLSRLTDGEFAWEPVDGSWRVFRGDDGRWTYDYEIPDPQPAPFTTIGWRLVHVAMCKVMYQEWAFGARELTWIAIETPPDVRASIEMLTRGHELLADDLAALRDEDLERSVLTNWGEPWPAWRIFTAMTDHDRHHGAEIGVLRDLYRIAGPFHV